MTLDNNFIHFISYFVLQIILHITPSRTCNKLRHKTHFIFSANSYYNLLISPRPTIHYQGFGSKLMDQIYQPLSHGPNFPFIETREKQASGQRRQLSQAYRIACYFVTKYSPQPPKRLSMLAVMMK